MENNDGGEEKTNDGEVSRSQDWVAVEDCDEDADVGAKQGEQNPCLVGRVLSSKCKNYGTCPTLSSLSQNWEVRGLWHRKV